jgi:quercetin dioxygenase-like cupin family protein
MSNHYVLNTQAQAVFSEDGPRPQMMFNSPNFKVVVVGLLAGQQLPLHADGPACYHFLAGEGILFVDEDAFTVQPGATVVVPNGAKRGITAKTAITFLGTKGGA